MIETVNLKIGAKLSMSDLIIKLDKFGFERNAHELSINEYGITGSLVKIKNSATGYLLLDFFGNLVDTIWQVDDENIKTKVKSVSINNNVLKLDDGSKIKPGSYLVHIDHGIGIYHGVGFKKINEEDKLYIFIEYLNNSFLYVPLKQKDKLVVYIGVGKRRPKLSSLGSQTWNKTKQKAYDNIILLARELLNIYAERELVVREPYVINREIDLELEKSFGFKETPDQIKAIADVYRDTELNRPTDRIICGDVGYGKTEVAIRAGGQAVANGYQVALLCPTTILAMQHYKVMEKRFKNLPINLESISRFKTKMEQNQIVEKIKGGQIDFIVGTHRLLSNDIKFKNLDLLIIDEEQRFGVKQKEKFKKVREKINVLSLSATPIPRTLFMALSGIRDISEINTPPKGRQSIETEVALLSDEKISLYVERELSRSGQVYYLHNEVRTIEAVAQKIKRMFPKSSVGVAHGQLPEGELARAMSAFSAGEIDILVCSTIMENGLDIPNVNTLIVDEAERFGLSQLYQIRGRIGRSERSSFCYLSHKEKKLTGEAYKRLKTLVENTSLGSGYNIALFDLELRGGGNILGREQHGTMEAVGLILYANLLKQAVGKLKGVGSRE